MNHSKEGLAIVGDPMLSAGLEWLFNRLGLQLLRAEDAAQFLRLLEERGPRISLIDLDGSVGDTKEDALNLLAEARMRSLSDIVALSRRGNLGFVSKALELGADDFWQSPLDKGLVSAKLARLFAPSTQDEPSGEMPTFREVQAPIRLSLPVRLHEINELGFTFLSSGYFPPGVMFRIDSETFHAWGAAARDIPAIALSSLVATGTNDFLTRAAFFNPRSEFLAAIRRWVRARAA